MSKRSTPSNGRAGRSSRNGKAVAGGGRAGATPSKQAGAKGVASSGQAVGRAVPGSRMCAEDLDHFRDALLRKRAELLGDVTHMTDEALRKNRMDATGDLSMMPIHMADIGTDNYEQEFTIGLISSERDTLLEIDAALLRLRDGTFGICEGTGKPIPKARLKAKPWARYRVDYKRMIEENGGNNSSRK